MRNLAHSGHLCAVPVSTSPTYARDGCSKSREERVETSICVEQFGHVTRTECFEVVHQGRNEDLEWQRQNGSDPSTHIPLDVVSP